jgi:hypothetical protein
LLLSIALFAALHKDLRLPKTPRECGYGISTIPIPRPMNTASI